MFTSQHENTYDYGITIISHKKPLPVSKLTVTTQIDIDINNDDNTQSIVTHKRKYKNTPDITETATTTTPVQATVNSRLCQMSSSTSTTLLNPPPPGK